MFFSSLFPNPLTMLNFQTYIRKLDSNPTYGLPGASVSELSEHCSPFSPIYTPIEIDLMRKDLAFVFTDKDAKRLMLDYLQDLGLENTSLYKLVGKKAPTTAEQKFMIDFVSWLVGKCTRESDLQHTPWLKELFDYRATWDSKKHVLKGEQIHHFICLLIDARTRFIKELKKLELNFPMDPNGYGDLMNAYLYYKYIVRASAKGAETDINVPVEHWTDDLHHILEVESVEDDKAAPAPYSFLATKLNPPPPNPNPKLGEEDFDMLTALTKQKEQKKKQKQHEESASESESEEEESGGEKPKEEEGEEGGLSESAKALAQEEENRARFDAQMEELAKSTHILTQAQEDALEGWKVRKATEAAAKTLTPPETAPAPAPSAMPPPPAPAQAEEEGEEEVSVDTMFPDPPAMTKYAGLSRETQLEIGELWKQYDMNKHKLKTIIGKIESKGPPYLQEGELPKLLSRRATYERVLQQLQQEVKELETGSVMLEKSEEMEGETEETLTGGEEESAASATSLEFESELNKTIEEEKHKKLAAKTSAITPKSVSKAVTQAVTSAFNRLSPSMGPRSALASSNVKLGATVPAPPVTPIHPKPTPMKSGSKTTSTTTTTVVPRSSTRSTAGKPPTHFKPGK